MLRVPNGVRITIFSGIPVVKDITDGGEKPPFVTMYNIPQHERIAGANELPTVAQRKMATPIRWVSCSSGGAA